MFMEHFFRAIEDQLMYCKLFHMHYYILECGFKFLKFWARGTLKTGLL
jgi:hypothetical protein